MSREFNELEKGGFIPKKVLLFYKQDYTSGNFYIEIANIVKRGKNYEQAESRPLTRKMFKNLMSGAVSEEKTFAWRTGYIPEGVIAYDPAAHKRYLVWYTKPGIKKMAYSDAKGKLSGYYPMPAMLYVMAGDELKVFALKGSKRPMLHDRLYVPPIHNTTGNGTMCWGSAWKKKDSTYFDQEMMSCEAILWDSRFTMHADYPMKSGALLSTVLKSVQNDKPVKNRFPVKELIETKFQLIDILKQLV